MDIRYKFPEISLAGTYIKIRDYLQQNIGRYLVQADMPKIWCMIPGCMLDERMIEDIIELKPVENVSVSEMLNFMTDATTGVFDEIIDQDDGLYTVKPYTLYRPIEEAFDFPFDIQFDSVIGKLWSLVQRTAELGDADSQYRMAKQLHYDEEMEEAITWYEKAAGQGDVRSILSLAYYYKEKDY